MNREITPRAGEKFEFVPQYSGLCSEAHHCLRDFADENGKFSHEARLRRTNHHGKGIGGRCKA